MPVTRFRNRSPRNPAEESALFHLDGTPASATAAFTDRDYQIRAVDLVIDGLQGGGRGQLLAACGTGKTKMAQWSAQQLVPHGGVVVIVAPTVGLVAQTLAAWNEGHDDHQALAVCSDGTVHDDSSASTADIVEPVTTDADVIDHWLRLPSTAAVRLIVGTHASAHIIGEGLQKAATAADLLVVDEAHRTAGWIGKHTALIHDDEVLPAVRRLYMTATPRVWNTGPDDSESATYSMDDRQVFGPVLFRYPFSQAISEGWLDDYRLAVIGVTRAEVHALLNRATTEDRQRSDAEHTAMVQAAVARAATELGLRRVIAFCPRVQDARRFAETYHATLASLPEHLRPRRPLYAAHVQGKMSQAQRKEILAKLANPPGDGWSVVANAKCLGEGIDVPAVDGVVFTAPKRSYVDIVQAVGRALRRAETGSGIATIIVPILLPDQHSGADTDIDPGDYEVLWEVVRGLRAHDDTFSAALDASRAGQQHTRAVTDRIQFLIPEGHTPPDFVEHLTIRLVKSATSRWWEGYGKLVQFHAAKGHTRVNHRHVTADGFNLGSWVSATRAMFADQRLGPDRIDALRELGFEFNTRAADWDRAFSIASCFFAERGHLRPHHTYRRDGLDLLGWLERQRRLHARGRLSPERIARLNSLGIEWYSETDWEKHLRAARSWHDEHGPLPHRQFTSISGALSKLRTARRDGRLPEEAIEELDAMGMVWEAPPQDWWYGYQRLEAFHAREGHTRVLQDHVDDEHFMLGAWVSSVRARLREGTLDASRTQALGRLGFVVNTREVDWDRGFAAVQAFYTDHGPALPPSAERRDGVALRAWLRGQHARRRRGALTAEQTRRLDSLRIAWEQFDTGTDLGEHIEQIRAWHAEYGAVPGFACYTTIAGPVRWVRASHNRGELTPEAIAELEALGLTWQQPEVDWWDGYARLERFHQSEGHCHVLPEDGVAEDGFSLHLWVKAVRSAHSRQKLHDDQVGALQRLGFLFDGNDAMWERAFLIARGFHDRHGHLLPPPEFVSSGLRLRSWLAGQRRQHANGQLRAEREQRLTALGMTWHSPRENSESARSSRRVPLPRLLPDILAFHAEHQRLPDADTEPDLAASLERLRLAYRKNTLGQLAVDALTAIGVHWYEPPQWWDGYAHLQRFHSARNHTDVDHGHLTDDGFDLGTWVHTTRAAYRQDALSPDAIAALDKLGFAPDAYTAAFERGFAAAQSFRNQHGHLRPEPGCQIGDVKLYEWLARQRLQHRNGQLRADRAARLDALGIDWTLARAWYDRIDDIRAFHTKHGCLPTHQTDRSLGRVVSRMRTARRAGELPEHVIAALDELGIDWDLRPGAHVAAQAQRRREREWPLGLAAARRYRQRYGHLDTRAEDPRDPADEIDLASWITRCRDARRKGLLTDAQIAELDALGMVWDGNRAAWEHSYAHCVAFHAEHGHLRVPRTHQVTDRDGRKYVLADWLNDQRTRRGRLGADEIARLDALGIDWDVHAARWEAVLTALRAFHAEHGHLRVPRDLVAETGTNVASALNTYRMAHRKGSLAPERTAALEELGIDWNPGGSTGAWNRTLAVLRAFHAEHGHILVPRTLRTDRGSLVCDWLTWQRRYYAEGKLTDAQIAELDALGMVWNKHASKWERTLLELRAFHAEHGHINIGWHDPETDPDGHRLYSLIKHYRATYRKGTIDPERVAALEELGIDWNPVDGHEAKWRETYAQVAAFHQRAGNLDIPPGHAGSNGVNLHQWLAVQRTARIKGELAPEKVALLDALGMDWTPPSESMWTAALAEARAYHAEYGPLGLMRANYRAPSGFFLYQWMLRQRKLFEQDELDPQRRAELLELGIDQRRPTPPPRRAPTRPKETWDRDIALLRAFHAEHGEINVGRQSGSQHHRMIGTIVSRLRAQHRAGRLATERVTALDELGIDWNPSITAWTTAVDAARRFHAAHGHLLPPMDYRDPDSDLDLYGWVVRRRSARAAGTMTDAEIAELDALGMVWDLPQAEWDHALNLLRALHAKHGTLHIPRGYTCTDLRGDRLDLRGFLHRQRKRRRDGQLTDAQIAELDALGMQWDPRGSQWARTEAALRAFHAEYGHLNAPYKHFVDGIDLGQVLGRARAAYAEGALEPERAAVLTELGIDWTWSASTASWQAVLDFLRAFHAEHGHLRVDRSRRTADGVCVRDWLTRQRNRRDAGELTDAQIAELDALGMVWSKYAHRDESWWASYAIAETFYRTHGHLRVRTGKPGTEIGQLYTWLRLQRVAYHDQTLAADRIAALEAIGIDWDPPNRKDAAWLDVYDTVVAFHREHGHLDFASITPRDDDHAAELTSLSKWLYHQRSLNAKDQLRPDRYALLDTLGVQWQIGREVHAWNRGLAALTAYCEEQGSPNTMPGGYKTPDGFGLYDWFARARRQANAGKLTVEQVQALLDLGVRFPPRRDGRR